MEARAYHTADNDLVSNVAEITRVLDQIDARPVKERQVKRVKSVAKLEDEMSSLVEKLNARAEGPPVLTEHPSAATERTT